MVDPLIITPISNLESGSEDLDDVVPLSEYKFDRSRLAMVKRPPKRRKVLVSGLEKPVTKGFEESTIWNISGPDVAWVDVETSTVIVEMALTKQTSTEAMVKEITWLKQYVVQFQAALVEIVKTATEEKQRSLDELKTTLEAKHEQET